MEGNNEGRARYAELELLRIGGKASSTHFVYYCFVQTTSFVKVMRVAHTLSTLKQH